MRPGTTTDAAGPGGLSAAEAAARAGRGERNIAVTGTSRTYGRILRTNVFSFYNSILFTIGAALLALGRYSDAFISVGTGPANALISAAQGPPLASILLILFLHPPARVFASWTDPTRDKRPTVLVVVLLVTLLGVLFTPALSDRFGLTGPAPPVYETVLPALVVWFLLLSAAYRFRLLDRVLALGSHR